MKHFQSNAAHSCEISHSSGNLQILVLKNTFHNTNTLNKQINNAAIQKGCQAPHYLSAGQRTKTLPGAFRCLTLQRYGVFANCANVCAKIGIYWII